MPPHSANPLIIRDDSHLTVPLISGSTSPVESSRSAAGSPGPRNPKRDRSVDPNPPLARYRGTGDSSTSSPENQKAEGSVYYTTVWGSPYAAPSPRRLSWSLSQYGVIDRGSGASSPGSMHSGLPHDLEVNNNDSLRPPAIEGSTRQPYSGSLNRSSGRGDFFGRKGGKSIKDFTQDWINQYLSGQPRTERSNWLSDDSGSEAPSFFTAPNNFAEDASDDWLALEQDTRDEDLLKTPTLSDFVGRRSAARNGEGPSSRPRAKEHHHKRADTLRQEDFWGFAYDQDPQPITMSDAKDAQSPTEQEPGKAPARAEKPLPPPPADDAQETSASNSAPPPEPKPMKTPEKSTTPRPRKKILWRGKACIIALPMEDKRGSEESGYQLMSVEDVNQRMKQWEEEGYDTRGFTVCAPEDPADIELGGNSRPTFPDQIEVYDDYKAGNYGVKIPNKDEWDSYVNFLQEEKLRALGVLSPAEEPPPSVSPASAALGQVAPFPGLVSSPPIPTASAASNPLSVPHPFSPHFNQSANPNNGIPSLASPASQFGVQTPFMNVEQQHMLPGFHMPFQPTPPTQGTLTPQSFFNARNVSGTSTMGGAIPNLTSMLSPVSPLHEQNGFHPGLNEQHSSMKDAFGNPIVHDMQDHMVDGQLLRPVHTPTNDDNFHASTVEIAQPTPRGHSRGHNLSETLQKGLDQMGPSDYHLEESIKRQLEEGDREPAHNFEGPELMKSRWAMPEDQNRNLHHLPQHVQQFYGGGYPAENAHEGSDIDTNPSLSGTPHVHGALPSHLPWHQSKPSGGSYGGGHRSKLSASTLNVDAKEFDPSASMSFQGNAADNPVFTFGSGAGFQPPSGTYGMEGPFTPGSARNSNAGPASGEFKFSPASFNVGAPAFNPSGSVHSVSSKHASPGRANIFGDIDLSGISKPAKKSKAIPIVRPDSVQEKKEEEERAADDNNGTASADRHKRARRGVESSDREAKFSISDNALAEKLNLQSAQPSKLSLSAAGKENTSPEKGDAKPSSKLERLDERKDTPVSEASTWAPEGKEEPKQDEERGKEQKKTPDAEPTSAQEKPAEPAKAQEPPAEKPAEKPAERGSIFSRLGKRFTFKPSVAEFVPSAAKLQSPSPQPTPAPKEPEPTPQPAAEEKKNDLMASRYAEPAPPAEPQNKPAPAETDNAEITAKALSAAIARQDDSDQGSPDEEELNAIMEQLNGDSDVGVERISTPHHVYRTHHESAVAPSKEKRHAPVEIRSEAPSPSPGRGPMPHALDMPKLDFDAQSQMAVTPSKGFASGMHSPIRKLVNPNDDHISDWDDVITSGEEGKLMNRSRFFDRRINDLVGSAVEERLSPLERALGVIQQSMAAIASGDPSKLGWSTSADAESDADDEDDEPEENASFRARSPVRQRTRKLDQLKSVILEAMAAREIPAEPEREEVSEIAQLRDSIAELQTLTIQKLSQNPTADLREMMEDVVSAQLAQQQPRPSDAEEIGADSLMLQIDGLKSMLRITDERAEQEYKLRRETQDSLAELQRLLKVAEEDAARHSEAAESAEARLLQFKEEKIPYFERIQFRTDSLEQDHATLKLTLAEVSSKNISLEGTLDEYRVTSDNWKRQGERANAELEVVRKENKKLTGHIDHMKTRIEDGISIRKNLSEKLDHIQEEMAQVTCDITRDQVNWRKREEQLNSKYNDMNAAYNREVKLREKLENDVSELEQQDREAAKLKFIFGQSQQENARLEELVANLRIENHELEVKATRFEREFNEARESSRMEIQRTRTSMEADLEAANSQVNIVRAELEAQYLRLQSQLDSFRLDSDTARERYEMLLEEANETKATSIAAVVESKEIAMEDQRKLHERTLNDLRERHARALHNSSEDKQRGEAHLLERLALSDERAHHLQDRVHHLEEKVEIAQSAARAAAEAAQKGKATSAMPSLHAGSPSLSFDKDSHAPEKISPQALRESILVLQDQLQQRESRIEELEQEVSGFDKDAPNTIREKDTEINWLRELLGVRIDDLEDIIKTVSQPSFDSNAVRDAAIRLRANLQMQQQEKERASPGQSFPSLRSLTELTSSPRSLPLAAAAAWGNWRKGRDSQQQSNPPEQTPSKTSNASAFLSGLLTPPSSHVRRTPLNASAPPPWRRTSGSGAAHNVDTTPRPLSSRSGAGNREPPKTPPLLRQSSYDHDAEPTVDYGESSLEEENEEIESTVDGLVSASPKDTRDDGPFGPQIELPPPSSP